MTVIYTSWLLYQKYNHGITFRSLKATHHQSCWGEFIKAKTALEVNCKLPICNNERATFPLSTVHDAHKSLAFWKFKVAYMSVATVQPSVQNLEIDANSDKLLFNLSKTFVYSCPQLIWLNLSTLPELCFRIILYFSCSAISSNSQMFYFQHCIRMSTVRFFKYSLKIITFQFSSPISNLHAHQREASFPVHSTNKSPGPSTLVGELLEGREIVEIGHLPRAQSSMSLSLKTTEAEVPRVCRCCDTVCPPKHHFSPIA